ncbi:MAG TPA: BrnT family toxin [Xanthobacteraceae bacterium]|nr:BrnT family toxin [Xanthobacteraceae bacterium]
MSREISYDFEWDAAKALSNVRKHAVTFDQAATIFLEPLALTVYDESSSQNEERWFTLGLDTGGKLLAVSHTYHMLSPASVRVRIISARPATKRERRCYEDEPHQVKP